jgi:hypothetical protein
MPLPYAVPEIQDNPEGWGPCNVPEHLKDVPFAPFSKGDKLGKAADWTQQAYQKNFPGAFGAAAVCYHPSSSQSRQTGSWTVACWLYSTIVCAALILAGRYQANPANAVFQFFHNEEVRMASSNRSRQQQLLLLSLVHTVCHGT